MTGNPLFEIHLTSSGSPLMEVEKEPELSLMENLTEGKKKQLKMCTTTPPFYISIEGWRYVQEIGTCLYTVEVGIQLESHVVIRRFERRFREMNEFAEKIGETYKEVTGFPPRDWLRKLDPGFIRQRYAALQHYFAQISQLPNITRFIPFLSFTGYKDHKNVWNELAKGYQKKMFPEI